MGRDLTFTPTAWNEYLDWQRQDKKIARKINELIKDIQRSPFEGIGKPEPLNCNSRDFTQHRVKNKKNNIKTPEITKK